LVDRIEAGDLVGVETRRILSDALAPMLAAGIDTIVLGCTHYPFVIPLIQDLTGPAVRTIDPAPAIARQTRRLLAERTALSAGTAPGQLHFFTSGSVSKLAGLLPDLLGESGPVTPVTWRGKTPEIIQHHP
jgi:glutamate racemase